MVLRRIAVCLALCVGARAQTGIRGFEVASVKPAAPPVMGMRDSCNPLPSRLVDPKLFLVRWKHLDQIILCAYNIEPYQLTGGPTWISTSRFDIEARTDSAATLDEMRGMLQHLLADRFQLKIHEDTQSISVTVVTVAPDGPKLGPRLRLLKEGETPSRASTNEEDRQYVHTIGGFAGGIWTALSRSDDPIPPILDQTGLEGRYEINLTGIGPRTEFRDWAQILDRQIGIHLEVGKRPMIVRTIDSVAQPSAN
jgi:uncharacterized protein (TIGR03435 family)